MGRRAGGAGNAWRARWWISIGAGILFGLAPALRLAKTDVNSAVKDGGHGAAGGRRGQRLASTLVDFDRRRDSVRSSARVAPGENGRQQRGQRRRTWGGGRAARATPGEHAGGFRSAPGFCSV